MKKIIALLLCCVLCLSLFACAGKSDATEPTDHDHVHESQPADSENVQPSEAETAQPSESVDDHSDHAHINYKGIVSRSATLQDFEAAEGKAPDFSFEANGVTYYAYNNVTFGELHFGQVQISLNENYVRISCTHTAQEGLDSIHAEWKAHMEETYGAPVQISENTAALKWMDHTGNYVTLEQLNDTTMQLCYYLVA